MLRRLGTAVARRVGVARVQAPRVARLEAIHRSRQVLARWAKRAEVSPRVLVPAQRAARAQAQKLHQLSFPTPAKEQTLRQRAAALKAIDDAAPTRARTVHDVGRGPGRDRGGFGR